jgi:SAM-dependent methyltransferase
MELTTAGCPVSRWGTASVRAPSPIAIMTRLLPGIPRASSRSRFPGLLEVYRALRRRRLRKLPTAARFAQIYHSNHWDSRVSRSGTGSEMEQTATIRALLPGLARDLGVKTLLDIPCGDFFWMGQVQWLGLESYVGADIVDEAIRRNQINHGIAEEPTRRFVKVDLIEDPLPKADMILCRDCLVHFAFADALRALRNIAASGAEYLVTTHFVGERENRDIVTGEWRPLNLERRPFGLPPPLRVINENCTEDGGIYADKSLGVWRIADLATAMKALGPMPPRAGSSRMQAGWAGNPAGVRP